MEASKYLLIALVLTICAVVFQLIGLASPYWTFVDATIVKVNFGLWKMCTETVSTGDTQCGDVVIPDGYTDDLNAVRAMGILGLLVLVVAVIMTVLKMFVLKEKKSILFGAVGTAFAGAVFILISIAIFAARAKDLVTLVTVDLDIDYHFAFALSIIGMIAAIGAGAVMLVEIMKG